MIAWWIAPVLGRYCRRDSQQSQNQWSQYGGTCWVDCPSGEDIDGNGSSGEGLARVNRPQSPATAVPGQYSLARWSYSAGRTGLANPAWCRCWRATWPVGLIGGGRRVSWQRHRAL